MLNSVAALGVSFSLTVGAPGNLCLLRPTCTAVPPVVLFL